MAGGGSVPIRATEAEAVLAGRVPDAGLLGEAAAAAAAATDPPSDIHAPAAYRREMTAVLTRRTIDSALGNEQPGNDDQRNGGAR